MAGIQNLIGCAGCATGAGLNWNTQGCVDSLEYTAMATLIVPCSATLTPAMLTALNPTVSSTVDINAALLALPTGFAVLPASVARLDLLPEQDATESDTVTDGFGGKTMFHPPLKNRKLHIYSGAKPAPSLSPISYNTIGYDMDDIVMRLNTLKKVALIGEIMLDKNGDIVLRWNVELDGAQKGIFPLFYASGSVFQTGANDNIQMYQSKLTFNQAAKGGVTHGGAIPLDLATFTFLGLVL